MCSQCTFLAFSNGHFTGCDRIFTTVSGRNQHMQRAHHSPCRKQSEAPQATAIHIISFQLSTYPHIICIISIFRLKCSLYPKTTLTHPVASQACQLSIYLHVICIISISESALSACCIRKRPSSKSYSSHRLSGVPIIYIPPCHLYHQHLRLRFKCSPYPKMTVFKILSFHCLFSQAMTYYREARRVCERICQRLAGPVKASKVARVFPVYCWTNAGGARSFSFGRSIGLRAAHVVRMLPSSCGHIQR
jgi:hypothetical protein